MTAHVKEIAIRPGMDGQPTRIAIMAKSGRNREYIEYLDGDPGKTWVTLFQEAVERAFRLCQQLDQIGPPE